MKEKSVFLQKSYKKCQIMQDKFLDMDIPIILLVLKLSILY